LSLTGKKFAHAALSVTLVVFLSKVVGFIRDMICAAYYGTGAEYDAFVSAYGLFYVPVLLISSCITSTIVPMYIDARDNEGPLAANRFANSAVNVSFFVGAAASLLMLFFAQPLTKIVYPGFSEEKTALTAHLMQIMLPSLAFVAVSIALSAILNANKRFVASQLTGFPLSFSWILATLLFSERFGIRAQAWGTFAAGLLTILVLAPFLRGRMQYTLGIDRNDPRLRRMLLLAVPAMLSMAVNELNHLIDRSIASSLNTGDISAMNYAFRLITFALGILSTPVDTVLFSGMSEKAAAKDIAGVKALSMESMEVQAMFALPATAIGIALSRDLIELVYQRGRFDAQSTYITSAIFSMYLAGLFFFTLRDMLSRTFHSMKDTRTPLIMACATVAVNVVLNLLLSRVMGAPGLALATSIASVVGVLLLFISLRQRCGALHAKASFIEIGKMALASAVAYGAARLLDDLIHWHGALPLIAKLLLVGIISLSVYGGLLYALRVKRLSFLKMLVKR
jgi:putative peptidoglycan lipid II flippase